MNFVSSSVSIFSTRSIVIFVCVREGFEAVSKMFLLAVKPEGTLPGATGVCGDLYLDSARPSWT